MKVEIREIGPLRLAFVRHVGPYNAVGETWERLTDWVGAEGLLADGGEFLGLSWDDPEVTPTDKLRYDACITVDAEVAPSEGVGLMTLSGGTYAATLHEGPYDRLGESYARLLGEWFPKHGREPGGPPSLEFYLNDPESTEPEDLLTEICMPIVPRGGGHAV